MLKKKLAIIVPIYNEEKNLKKFIKNWSNLKLNIIYKIVFINDGSNDNSLKIINKNKFTNIILINKKNEGHGKTILYGYRYAIKKNYDFIFQVDSDNQFSSKDFYKIWGSRFKSFDIICGCRHKRKDPVIRVLLTKICLRIFILLITFKIIDDPNTPFRLINKNFLKKFLSKIKKNNYIAPNILMSLSANKIINHRVTHFKNKDPRSKWSKIKLFKFCFKLFLDIIKFKF
jgi:dolichol-phosphate mannosyltransferase